jgi:hypothetical protein
MQTLVDDPGPSTGTRLPTLVITPSTRLRQWVLCPVIRFMLLLLPLRRLRVSTSASMQAWMFFSRVCQDTRVARSPTPRIFVSANSAMSDFQED